MPIDTTKAAKEIAAEIARLQELQRVLSDPKSAELLERLLVPKGAESTVRPTQIPQPPLADDQQTNGALSTVERGDKIRAVRTAIQEVVTNQFTVVDIGNAVRSKGLVMNNIAVSKAMKRLEKAKFIVRVHTGGPSDPNRYERAKET